VLRTCSWTLGLQPRSSLVRATAGRRCSYQLSRGQSPSRIAVGWRAGGQVQRDAGGRRGGRRVQADPVTGADVGAGVLFQLGQDAQRLVRNLELADAIDQDLIRDINERRAELRARRSELGAQLAAAENDAREEPSPALLAVTPVDLAGVPDEVSRPLFEALRLEIRYDFTTRIATCQITLTGQTIDAVVRTSRQKIPSPPPPRHAAPPNRRRKRHRHPKRGWSVWRPQ